MSPKSPRLDVPRGTNFIAIHLRGATQIYNQFLAMQVWCRMMTCLFGCPQMRRFFFDGFLWKNICDVFFGGETILCASGLYLKMLRSCLDSLHSFQPTKLKFDFATSFRHRGHCLRSKSTCCWWTGGFGTWGHGDGGGLVGDPRFWKKGSWYRDWTIKYHEKMTHKSWQMLFGLGQSNIVTDTFQQMQRQ